MILKNVNPSYLLKRGIRVLKDNKIYFNKLIVTLIGLEHSYKLRNQRSYSKVLD